MKGEFNLVKICLIFYGIGILIHAQQIANDNCESDLSKLKLDLSDSKLNYNQTFQMRTDKGWICFKLDLSNLKKNVRFKLNTITKIEGEKQTEDFKYLYNNKLLFVSNSKIDMEQFSIFDFINDKYNNTIISADLNGFYKSVQNPFLFYQENEMQNEEKSQPKIVYIYLNYEFELLLGQPESEIKRQINLVYPKSKSKAFVNFSIEFNPVLNDYSSIINFNNPNSLLYKADCNSEEKNFKCELEGIEQDTEIQLENMDFNQYVFIKGENVLKQLKENEYVELIIINAKSDLIFSKFIDVSSINSFLPDNLFEQSIRSQEQKPNNQEYKIRLKKSQFLSPNGVQDFVLSVFQDPSFYAKLKIFKTYKKNSRQIKRNSEWQEKQTFFQFN